MVYPENLDRLVRSDADNDTFILNFALKDNISYVDYSISVNINTTGYYWINGTGCYVYKYEPVVDDNILLREYMDDYYIKMELKPCGD